MPNKLIDAKRLGRISRETISDRKSEEEYKDYKSVDVSLLVGDFREKASEIADETVDMIFTDPPYDKAALELWESLAELAAQKLKPGGILASYTGSLYLPQVFEILGKKLTYLWTAAIYHKNGKNLVPLVNVNSGWKPILIYYKPPFNKYWKPFTDIISGGEEKKLHDWEQSIEEAAYYINALCPAEGVLLDPMMGSGTSIIAGLNSARGLKCIGIDSDKAAYAVAEQRLREYSYQNKIACDKMLCREN